MNYPKIIQECLQFSVGDDNATFDITKVGVKYTVTLNDAGTGYARGNTLTIPGTSLGGVSTANDVTVTVTAVQQCYRRNNSYRCQRQRPTRYIYGNSN